MWVEEKSDPRRLQTATLSTLLGARLLMPLWSSDKLMEADNVLVLRASSGWLCVLARNRGKQTGFAEVLSPRSEKANKTFECCEG